MRVLLTTDTIGGVWTFTAELTTELLNRGHSVALVSFGRAPSHYQASWAAATLNRFGISFHYVPSTAPLEWMQSNRSAYTAAAPLLLRIADAFLPDLLHTSQFCFGSLPLAMPKVITAHSDVLSWASACRHNVLEPSPWLYRYKSMVERGLAGADAIVAPTRWMVSALRQHFSFIAPARVILNGRNLLSAPADSRKLQAVSAGRFWDEAKNLSLLTNLDSPIPIIVAGEQEHEDSIAPASLGSVIPVGALSEYELLSLFRESSLYIAPSIYEPFGLAPLEAALCGCALLTNDIPSLHEIWGDAAIYFQDASTLSQALKRLCSDKNYLLRAQNSAGNRARQLTATCMADSYLNLYREVLVLKTPVPAKELAAYAV